MNISFTFTANGKVIDREVNVLRKIYEVIYSILDDELKDTKINILGLCCNATFLDPNLNFISQKVEENDNIIVQSNLIEEEGGDNGEEGNENAVEIINNFGISFEKQEQIIEVVKTIVTDNKIDLTKKSHKIHQMLKDILNEFYLVSVFIVGCGALTFKSDVEALALKVGIYKIVVVKCNN